jgi:hypothetical protein
MCLFGSGEANSFPSIRPAHYDRHDPFDHTLEGLATAKLMAYSAATQWCIPL